MSGFVNGAVAAVFLLGVLWYFSPAAEPRFRLCGFFWLTGRECPFCGLTRALFALAKGHWSEALRFHALSPLGFAMLFTLFWKGPPRARCRAPGSGAFTAYGLLRERVP